MRGGQSQNQNKSKNKLPFRLRLTVGAVFLFLLAIGARLFILMVLEHDFYTALAKGSQEIYSKLVPQRGKIYLQDKNQGYYPLAINRDFALVYANPNRISGETEANEVVSKLENFFDWKKKERKEILDKLTKQDDPYEIIKQKVKLSKAKKIKKEEISGINTSKTSYRYYPEKSLAATTVGFLGRNKQGEKVGRYGAEGYWDKKLSGQRGFLSGTRSASGSVIPFNTEINQAKDGANIYLTLDRTLQYQVCNLLKQAKKKYKAEGASLVIMNPNNGSIEALCSLPNFNPNQYGEAETVKKYNNSSIYQPYEIGSIFKPIVMTAALEGGVVSPDTSFKDPGVVKDICDSPIRNSRSKVYDETDMTGVLEKSINTGMVKVAKLLGKKDLVNYIEKFGFGTKTGIRLNTERAGRIDSLYINKGNKIDCYAATASFGQGITATPIQMVAAYSAIINGGKLLKPYVIEKIKYPSGNKIKTKPKQIRRVVSKEKARLAQAMLVSVIKNGHADSAGVRGYQLGGKTGTAQISKDNARGYTDETNHSFVGFGPAKNPKFVMIVKFHKPDQRFSSQTAAPTFGKISEFLLDYYQVAPKK
jgi:cell division protein FtsI/penicillin-binding protein 2